jgi:hypothetical protein
MSAGKVPGFASLAGAAEAPLIEEMIDDMSWRWLVSLQHPVQVSSSRRMAGEDGHTATPLGHGYTELVPDTGIDFLKHHRHSCPFVVLPEIIIGCRVHSAQAKLSYN